METNMNVYQKLMAIQTSVKAPKNQYNIYGKFNYRSAESILEALKPYLAQYNVLLLIKDEIVTQGIGRKPMENGGVVEIPLNYVKATARFIDCDSGNEIETSAFARECVHKGMSEDQCTGTASSYARKYCLNAMFLLDDTKDSDTDEMKNIENAASQPAPNPQTNNAASSNNNWGNRPAASNAQPARQQSATTQKSWGKQRTA